LGDNKNYASGTPVVYNNKQQDDKTTLQALSLLLSIIATKYIMDLATNGVVITDAIKFVQNSKGTLNQYS
jgi:ethanolamine ammonia-lyase large subunit